MSLNLGNIFTPLLKAITPPPLVQPQDYEGLEYRWRFFVVRPHWLREQLQIEIFLVPALLFYVAFIFYGKYTNSKRANKWFEEHLTLLQEQFSKPSNGGLTQDGYSDYFNFSTGRRGITSLHTVFTLRPRHDFFQIAFQFLWGLQDLSYRPADEIELDFRLADGLGVPDFVFGVVSKEEMVTIRDKRWDLTFTKTSENASLPPSLSVMTEFADVTEQILDKLSLGKILSDPAILPYFRSLSVSDQPRDRPFHPIPSSERQNHLILSLTAPPPSHAADTLPFITALFGFIDSLPKVTLRSETRTKLKKAREEVDKAIKEDSEKDKKDEVCAAARLWNFVLALD
jgi:hypothetical protein